MRALVLSRLTLGLLALAPGSAFARPAADGPAETSTSTQARTSTRAAAGLVPPKALLPLAIAYPEGAPPLAEDASVTVRLRVDETGAVLTVELVRGIGAPFDAAVLEGAARFAFAPALYFGTPVPVDINFTQRFPASPLAARAVQSEVRLKARLAGILREKGTRRAVPYAQVLAWVGDERAETSSDEAGRFSLDVGAGTATVSVVSSGHRPFVQVERLVAGERLEVSYLVEAERYSPYEIVVIGKLDRKEVARTVLSGRDIQQIPGTFGDPFRVIGTLPGVSSVMSLLPFPVVRGSSPGNTGFLIDGVRVPLLFHLLAGPSVIHPELIDQIEFSPGGFPVEYGGYTGGIVDGKTRAAGPEEHKIDLDLNLFQVGGLVRQPIPWLDGTGTVAARYGFPGLLLSLASPTTSLSYWDYQARFDGGTKSSGYTLFFFGANDALDQTPAGQPTTAAKEPLLHFQFHRADLRYHTESSGLEGSYQLTLGYDGSLSNQATLESFEATPRIRITWSPSREIDLRFGLDGSLKRADYATSASGAGIAADLLGANGSPSNTLFSGGLLAEALYHPIDRLLIRPGVRVDIYDDTNTRHGAIDPRVLGRYRILDEGPEVWLKGSLGLFHQPPRFTVPIPGLDEIAFGRGLLESAQVMVGSDVVLDGGWSLDAQTYFNWMDPILYDLQLNPSVEDLQKLGPTAPPGVAPATVPVDTSSPRNRLDRLLGTATGRSYGFELLVRRRSSTGVSGWLAYTLSRSERLRDGGWNAFDFDRAHIVNLVVTIPLPRRWQLGLRAEVETGRPLTTTTGLATARTDPFVRFDLRADKTAVFHDWLLDFYVDITNVALGAEEVTTGANLRYVLPTAGFRAIF